MICRNTIQWKVCVCSLDSSLLACWLLHFMKVAPSCLSPFAIWCSHTWCFGVLSKLCLTVVRLLLAVVQLLSHVQLFTTAWTAARQASLSITLSLSLLKLKSIESMMPSNHLILWHPPSPLTLSFFQHQGLFQFINSYIIFHCKIHHELFTHSLVDGFCSSFQIFLAITN